MPTAGRYEHHDSRGCPVSLVMYDYNDTAVMEQHCMHISSQSVHTNICVYMYVQAQQGVVSAH